MADPIPAGAIPLEEFNAQSIPPGAIPADQFESDQEKHGNGLEIAKTALEQGLSGATLGASKVLETKLLGVNPEDIAGREAANPITSTLSNIGGGAALVLGTGGLGAIPEGAGLAAKIGVGAVEGAGIGGVNQITDDWSQNKALDAQKIVASAGLGALIGGAGSGIAGVIGNKLSPLTRVSSAIEKDAANASEAIQNAAAPPIDAPKPQFKGVQPTTIQDIADRVSEAKANNTAIPLPSQAILDDALSRVEMENPVNPLQRESLNSQEYRDIYQTGKETPGKTGAALQNYEALQKQELVGKAEQAIKDLSPSIEPTGDAYQGGKYAINAFSEQYQNEKNALKPVFQAIKPLPVEGDLLPDAVIKMTDAVPGIANMFDTSGAEIKIKPYTTAWGIDKATYNAAKEAVGSLKDAPNDLESLWNVRKGLDQHIDVLAQGQAPSEIRALKAALMEQMQESSGNPEIRDAFRRYAINEQQRQVIEKTFGASVGSPEFGQISKVKPELIGDKIFSNSATVEAAKNILPPEKFQAMLANWISEAKEAATDKGAFSSNKFGTFLRRNQDALNVAFKDNPEQLQRLKDLTTIMRILPDAPSVNPSGTAKTLLRQIADAKIHDMTFEGLIGSIPQKIAVGIADKIKMNELNAHLSGEALKNAQSNGLKDQAARISGKLDRGVKNLFSSSASESRKIK